MQTSQANRRWLSRVVAIVAGGLLVAGCAGTPTAMDAPGASVASATVGGGSASDPALAASRATVERFLRFYFGAYGSGLPSTAERAQLESLLTGDFLAAIDAAVAAEACVKRRHGGTEPPMIQGDLFSSLFEKATAAIGMEVKQVEPNRVDYDVHFEYRQPGAAEAENTWRDRFVLAPSGGTWLIDDIVHGGEWQFANPGSVKAMLARVEAQCPQSQY